MNDLDNFFNCLNPNEDGFVNALHVKQDLEKNGNYKGSTFYKIISELVIIQNKFDKEFLTKYIELNYVLDNLGNSKLTKEQQEMNNIVLYNQYKFITNEFSHNKIIDNNTLDNLCKEFPNIVQTNKQQMLRKHIEGLEISFNKEEHDIVEEKPDEEITFDDFKKIMK